MNFSELQQALTIRTGTLTPNIDALIASSYVGQPIVISGAVPGPSDGQNETVVIKGKSSFLNVADLPIVASFIVDQDGNAQAFLKYPLLGDLPGPNDWRFSISFPELPPVVDWNKMYEDPTTLPLDDLALSNASFIVVSQDQKELAFDVDLKIGINFVSNMRPTGIVRSIENLFDNTEPLVLYGTIHIPGATSTTLPLKALQYPWDVEGPVPGILLQAKLGLNKSFGQMVFEEIVFQIYTPHTSDWLQKNTTYRPILGYTGTLNIPSAALSVDVTAPMAIGGNELLLFGHFEGFTVDKLASLADIAVSLI